jgi:predicted CoA-binding protein
LIIENKKTLVFGASLNTSRASNRAVKMLREKSIDVVAIGGKAGKVSDVAIDTELEEYGDINTITLYMGEKRQKEFQDYLLSLNPRRIIFNPGAENHDFFLLSQKKGIEVINACTLVLLSLNDY